MGLFSTPDYGATGYKNGMTADISSITGGADRFGNVGAGQMAGYGNYAPQSDAATDAYARQLAYDPNSDPYRTAQLNQATAGIAGDTAMGQSNLTAGLASRGMTGDSSMLTGGLASILGTQNAVIGNARNQIAANAYQQHLANLGQRQNLLSVAASGYYNRGLDAYGQAQQGYGQAYAANDQQYQQAIAQQQAYKQQMMQGIGAVAGLAGGAFGGTGGGMLAGLGGILGGSKAPGAAPAAQTYQPYGAWDVNRGAQADAMGV